MPRSQLSKATTKKLAGMKGRTTEAPNFTKRRGRRAKVSDSAEKVENSLCPLCPDGNFPADPWKHSLLWRGCDGPKGHDRQGDDDGCDNWYHVLCIIQHAPETIAALDMFTIARQNGDPAAWDVDAADW